MIHCTATGNWTTRTEEPDRTVPKVHKLWKHLGRLSVSLMLLVYSPARMETNDVPKRALGAWAASL